MAALLKEAYPNNIKWQLFKKVKFYLCANTTESDEMLRNLGNVNNTLAGLQKKLGFVDKIRQLHTYFEQHGLLNGAAKKRMDHKGCSVTLFLDELARAWGMKPASMGHLSPRTVARHGPIFSLSWTGSTKSLGPRSLELHPRLSHTFSCSAISLRIPRPIFLPKSSMAPFH